MTGDISLKSYDNELYITEKATMTGYISLKRLL
jgi:hypothetical protein